MPSPDRVPVRINESLLCLMLSRNVEDTPSSPYYPFNEVFCKLAQLKSSPFVCDTFIKEETMKLRTSLERLIERSFDTATHCVPYRETYKWGTANPKLLDLFEEWVSPMWGVGSSLTPLRYGVLRAIRDNIKNDNTLTVGLVLVGINLVGYVAAKQEGSIATVNPSLKDPIQYLHRLVKYQENKGVFGDLNSNRDSIARSDDRSNNGDGIPIRDLNLATSRRISSDDGVSLPRTVRTRLPPKSSARRSLQPSSARHPSPRKKTPRKASPRKASPRKRSPEKTIARALPIGPRMPCSMPRQLEDEGGRPRFASSRREILPNMNHTLPLLQHSRTIGPFHATYAMPPPPVPSTKCEQPARKIFPALAPPNLAQIFVPPELNLKLAQVISQCTVGAIGAFCGDQLRKTPE